MVDGALLERLRGDEAAWDSFVESTSNAQYLQLSRWGRVKAANGWRTLRVVADGGSGPIGAQVLVHRLGRLPFALGYAACGPLATAFDQASIDAFTAELRRVAGRSRLSHVTIDPMVSDPAIVERLRAAGWRPTARVQITQTWVVDLAAGEAALWHGLRSKWRQYVQKALRSGLVIEDAGAAGIDELFSVLAETSDRVGFVLRSPETYRLVFDSFAPAGRARLLLARLPGGEPVAALMLIACDGKVVEPYGGMTVAGAQSRANYLLKWEAMRSSAELGYQVYDMWGMPTPGVAQFKQGFGGREVDYIGAFDLVVSPALRVAFTGYHALRVRAGRLRHGERGLPLND